MIGYIVSVCIISIIISIITEHLVMRRLQLEEGIIIQKGICKLAPGYGKINNSE